MKIILRIVAMMALFSIVVPTWAHAQTSPRSAWRAAISLDSQREHCAFFVSCVRTGRPPEGSPMPQCPPGIRVAPTGTDLPACSSSDSPWLHIEMRAFPEGSATVAQSEQQAAQEIIRLRQLCYNVASRADIHPEYCPNDRDLTTNILCESASAQCSDASLCRHQRSYIKCFLYSIFADKSQGPEKVTDSLTPRDTAGAAESGSSEASPESHHHVPQAGSAGTD